MGDMNSGEDLEGHGKAPDAGDQGQGLDWEVAGRLHGARRLGVGIPILSAISFQWLCLNWRIGNTNKC